LPDQCLEAWRLVQEQQLPAAYGDVRNVVVMGMGGSAIGGDLVRAFCGQPEQCAHIRGPRI
jgi:glucose/mannose-6-phosphate isomerase